MSDNIQDIAQSHQTERSQVEGGLREWFEENEKDIPQYFSLVPTLLSGNENFCLF